MTAGTVIALIKALSGSTGGNGGGSSLVVHGEVTLNTNDGTIGNIVLDKTWREIYGAMSQGQNVVIDMPITIDGDEYPTVVMPTSCGYNNNQFYVVFYFGGSDWMLVTDTEYGHPSLDSDGIK